MQPINVVLADWIWRRKIWLFYLIVADNIFEKNEISLNITPEFENITFGYAKAYIEKGEMPPADIAPAILNMADDYMSGRQVAIRTGDYIAIQTHIRKGGRPK
ncbi:MAG: hypothetical protein WA655_05900 [Candidatus Korobacteraceae bacterium]